MTRGNKDASLEALRGFAAIVVVFWHAMLAFFPAASGVFDQSLLDQSLAGQPWFGVLNGPAAVGFFFALSGFVLTRGYFQTNDDISVARGAIKRWPRLAVPVLAAVLMSWGLFGLGLYRFVDVAAVTNSSWLGRFGGAYRMPFVPDFWHAMAQGTFLTFFRGDFSYDSSLWTMRIELIGSYIAFALAIVLVRLPAASPWIKVFLLIVVAALCHYANPNYVAFPAGVALAFFLVRRPPAMPSWLSAIVLVLSGYLAGYSGHPIGAYRLFAVLSDKVPPIYVHIIAGVIAIAAVEAWAEMRQIMRRPLFLFVGEISFPLYLVHIPVLCSVGCWAFLAVQGSNAQWAPWIAAAATFVCSFLVATPLMLLNRAWLAALNRFVSRAIPAKSITPSSAAG